MVEDKSFSSSLDKLHILLGNLQETESLKTARKLLDTGIDPFQIVECCKTAMGDVGKSYEQGRYYISGLMMAGEILRQIMELVFPLLKDEPSLDISGRILIGTIQGDIHDIGKNLVAMLFRCHGFEILDLGVDVPPDEFIAQVKAFSPDIVAISALLTTSHNAIKETIEQLRKNEVKTAPSFKTIIGGGFVDEVVCRYVGADFWARDAMVGVRYCEQFLSKK